HRKLHYVSAGTSRRTVGRSGIQAAINSSSEDSGVELGRLNDRADVLALQRLRDVPRNEPVDDLDLLLMLGVPHEVQDQRADRKSGKLAGPQIGCYDPRDELRPAPGGSGGAAGALPVAAPA